MGEWEGEVCCYGEESVGRNGGVEKGDDLNVLVNRRKELRACICWYLSMAFEGIGNFLCHVMSDRR